MKRQSRRVRNTSNREFIHSQVPINRSDVNASASGGGVGEAAGAAWFDGGAAAGAVAGAGLDTGTGAGAGDVGGGFTGTFDLAGTLDALVSLPVALRTADTNGSPPCGVGTAPVRMLLNGTILP